MLKKIVQDIKIKACGYLFRYAILTESEQSDFIRRQKFFICTRKIPVMFERNNGPKLTGNQLWFKFKSLVGYEHFAAFVWRQPLLTGTVMYANNMVKYLRLGPHT